MMGMYDSIYIEVKCPFCGNEETLECQTKDLDCELNEYFKGDFVLSKKPLTEMTESRQLYCTAECMSQECAQTKKVLDGSEVKNGRFFNLWIVLRGGIVTGEYIKNYNA